MNNSSDKLIKILYLPMYNKLWGVYLDSNRFYWCWWAEVGKGISVVRHKSYFHAVKMEKIKKANGYIAMSNQELLELWPDFFERLNQRLIFEVLTDDH